MSEKIYLLLLFVFRPIESIPLNPSLQLSIPGVNEYENTMDVPEGDMLDTCTDCLWPKAADGTVPVPYTFGFTYSGWQLELFNTSMEEYNSLTCVRFVPRTKEDNYLNIMSPKGCFSYVGKIGGGQMVGLDAFSCMFRGHVQHQLNHALGFNYEQRRSDLDNDVMYQDIAEGNIGNFVPLDTNNLGVEHDYGSVLNGNKYAFTNKLEEPKPEPVIPYEELYGMTFAAVSRINRLYNCDVCSMILKDVEGTLSSANFPSPYPDNSNCVWLIRAPTGQITLNFVAFDVQSSPDCASDYIRIYDGPSKRSPLIMDKTCGNTLIPPIIASTHQVLVEFSSDSSIAKSGFKASYSSVQCGGAFYAPQKTFTSPNYPRSYDKNSDCTYTITAPDGQRVRLTFTDFVTEYSSTCNSDYLEVMDGTRSTRWGPFCGANPIPVITSPKNILIVKFITDYAIQTRGFQASYTFIPSTTQSN